MIQFAFDPTLKQCPWTAIPRDAFAHVRAWDLWTSLGVLPYGGAMKDQPQSVIEAFELCAEAQREMEALEQTQERARDRQQLVQLLGARR
jgi:hypothetical protein